MTKERYLTQTIYGGFRGKLCILKTKKNLTKTSKVTHYIKSLFPSLPLKYKNNEDRRKQQKLPKSILPFVYVYDMLQLKCLELIKTPIKHSNFTNLLLFMPGN